MRIILINEIIELIMKNKFLNLVIWVTCTSLAHADLPLSLEELLTDKGKLKLESSISYVNTERSQTPFMYKPVQPILSLFPQPTMKPIAIAILWLARLVYATV